MAEPCDCTLGLSNTGSNTNCKTLISIARKVILVNTFDSAGVRTQIPAGTTITDAYASGKRNESNPQDRWFPTPSLDNVEHIREDSVFFTTSGGANIKVRDGVKPFVGVIIDGTTEYFNQFSNYRCADISAYVVDTQGNLRGTKDDDGNFFPIRINASTWDAGYIEATDDAPEMTRMKWEWSQDESDAKLRAIKASDIEASLLEIDGLFDILGTLSGIQSATTFTLLLETIFDVLVTGLVTGDFTLLNVGSQLPVVLTSVTESQTVPGRYDFLFPTQAGSIVQPGGSKIGFDFAKLEALQIQL